MIVLVNEFAAKPGRYIGRSTPPFIGALDKIIEYDIAGITIGRENGDGFAGPRTGRFPGQDISLASPVEIGGDLAHGGVDVLVSRPFIKSFDIRRDACGQLFNVASLNG